jgi:hypothetical protein
MLESILRRFRGLITTLILGALVGCCSALGGESSFENEVETEVDLRSGYIDFFLGCVRVFEEGRPLTTCFNNGPRD